MTVVVAVVAAAAITALSSSACADPGDTVFSLTPAYAAVDFDSRTPSGVGLAVEVGYGISDSFWLRGAGVFSAHPADADTTLNLPQGTITVVSAFGGARYAFDLLRTIPY